MKRPLLIGLVALALSSQAFAGGVWHKSVDAAQKKAKEKKQLILVDMFAEWCGWCHRFEREVFPSQVFQEATEDIVLLRLDTEDKGEGTTLARKYGVTQLPTFVLLAPDLSIAGMIRGYAPPAEFVKMLKETRGKYDSFTQKVAAEPKFGKDYAKHLDLAKEFVERTAFDKSEPRLKKLMTEKGVPAAIRDDAYYHLAMSYVLQNKLDDAMKVARQLSSLSKAGDPVERSRLLVAQIYMQQGNLLGAATELRNFKKDFPSSPLIANVNMILPNIEKRLAQ